MKKRTVRKIKEFFVQIFVAVLFLTIFCVCSWYETHYTKTATVISVYENIVTVKDTFEDEWEFEDNERQYHKGDKVKLTMNSLGTIDNIYDDKIENVKKVVDK